METKSETNTNLEPLSQNVPNLNLLSALFYWYYAVATRNILYIWGGYLAANLHYFSVPLLLRTLFAHWHKDVEGYGRGFDFGRYFRVFTMNAVSRLVGACVRSVIIFVGVLFEVFIFIAGIAFFAFWLVAPVALIFAFLEGIALIS
jgi:hypothetical protein